MNSRLGIFFAAVVIPFAASAQDPWSYRCSSGDLVRRVEVAYSSSAPLPCEVRYYKDTEAPGQAEVPWSASNESGYCESRAEDLVGQLRGWGWSCVAAERAVADDTDALAAGEAQQ